MLQSTLLNIEMAAKGKRPIRVSEHNAGCCSRGNGAALVNNGEIDPCCKAFKVEKHHTCMLSSLRSFVCPYPHPSLRRVGAKGHRADVRLQDTEHDCVGMGYILARCVSSPRSLGTAVIALDGESL